MLPNPFEKKLLLFIELESKKKKLKQKKWAKRIESFNERHKNFY